MGAAHARITPARAGSTSNRQSLRHRGADHPRSRGEHSSNTGFSGVPLGSPPLARGAPCSDPLGPPFFRITPARAGSTVSPARRCLSNRDHPRSRGEHIRHTGMIRVHLGSPPLARGAPDHEGADAVEPGITPARAGSTKSAGIGCPVIWDHPRSRGEHFGPFSQRLVDLGSPPLARGALRVRNETSPFTGITPARAGSTKTAEEFRDEVLDHPRSRGEHVLAYSYTLATVGSPPLARGAHTFFAWFCGGGEGITPARAGSTVRSRASPSSQEDHPRSRGEHLGEQLLPVVTTGSPPLARGARPLGGDRTLRRRITPARAGSTCRNGLVTG